MESTHIYKISAKKEKNSYFDKILISNIHVLSYILIINHI